MQYEKEILTNLLLDLGFSCTLNDEIKPNKHPNMAYLEATFNHIGIKYLYFPDTDSLAITQIDMADDSGIYNSLCHTIIMPSRDGLSVLVVVPTLMDREDVLEQMTLSLDSILPPEINYSLVGII
tara:strand:+ start:924 stop:1298 length:375 start_codon:yes stop_codon:yes gene_type:complete